MGHDRGSNRSYGTVFLMAAPNDVAESELDLIVLPRGAAVAAVQSSWDANRAVCVLDPATPPATLRRLIERLRPHAIVDASGRTLRDDPLANNPDLCAAQLPRLQTLARRLGTDAWITAVELVRGEMSRKSAVTAGVSTQQQPRQGV